MNDTEREAFEALVAKRWGGGREELRIRDMPGSERLGEYVNPHVHFAWEAYQEGVAKERERCAGICEGIGDTNKWSDAHACANAIRRQPDNCPPEPAKG